MHPSEVSAITDMLLSWLKPGGIGVAGFIVGIILTKRLRKRDIRKDYDIE